MTSARRRVVIFVAVAFVTLALDQGSKAWARDALVPGHPQAVVACCWDWELAYNPGVAFSTFAGAAGGRAILSVLAALAVLAIAIVAARTPPGARLRRAALAMIAGGALGNLVDRVREGAVTDFVRWRVHEHRWPIFNLADAALLVGAVLLVADGFFARRRDRAMLSA